MSKEKKGKKVLVTGGAGFIGYHLTQELVKRGYQVTLYDNLYRGDISRFQNLMEAGKVNFIEGDIRYISRLLEACKGIDYIFHEAADCINKSLQNPAESFAINVMGTNNVFEAARLQKVKKVIFASSASVYGDPDTLPITENHPIKPITPYCVGKATIENIANFYAKFFGIKYIGFRYFNVYGPFQNIDAYYTNVVIIFLKRIMQGEPPRIDGEGKQSMDFIHVKDIVAANILALETQVTNEIFNLGTNISTTIAQLASLLLKAAGKTNLVPIFTGRKTIVQERRADFSKARNLLGWQPQIGVEEGLQELARDIMAHPENY